MKKTIETKIAKNGVKLYYVDGKRTSREVALQAAADNRENLFTIEYATRHTAYFTGRILDATQVYESTSKAVLKELELKIDEYHGFTVKLHTIGWVEICKLFNKDYAKSLINKIENAFIRGEYGVKIDKYGKVSILTAPVVEPDPDLYAITPEAFDEAVNAEIQNANNEAPKFKYYLQSRRPIAGAVPNGYISATQGEMKAYSLRSDGSISPVPRKVVFGVVVYDHPLSDQQIINYDLHVDPLNPKVEPATTELSDEEIAEIKRRSQINAIKSRIATYERAIERQYDQDLENSLIAAKAQLAEIEPDTTEPDEPKFQVGKSYYIKDGDNYYILKVEARTDKMLTGTTPHGTCKFHIHDTFKGEYIRTHLYDDCGNREMIWAANEYKPQVDPIIQERDTARNEYEEINQVRRLIEKDCERYERLRDRCKSGSTKRKEYNQLLADLDPIIRAFGQKFIAAQDRYNKSLTLRTDEERAATQKAVDEYNADLDARGIKYFATVYYYPNGIEGEDMETFCKDCTSLDEANAFVSQEDHDGVYVGGIYDAGWEITDRNHNLIADHITGIKKENVMTIKGQADFLADKIKRECASIDDSTTDLDQLNDIDDEIVTPVENRHKLIGKWNETLFDPEFKHGTTKMIFTMQGLKHQAKVVWFYISVNFDKGKYKFRMGNLLLSKYDTPAQVEKVIDLLKVAITRGDKAFTFPTVEELDPNPDDELIDPPAETLNHQQKKNLRDSLERAKQIACRNISVARRNHNKDAEDYERELYDICNQALKEVA